MFYVFNNIFYGNITITNSIKFSLYFIIDWILYIASISFLKSSELLLEVSLSALKHVLFASDKENQRMCLRLRIADSVAVHWVICFKVSFLILNSFSRFFLILCLEANLRSASNLFIPDAVKLSKPPTCAISWQSLVSIFRLVTLYATSCQNLLLKRQSKKCSHFCIFNLFLVTVAFLGCQIH